MHLPLPQEVTSGTEQKKILHVLPKYGSSSSSSSPLDSYPVTGVSRSVSMLLRHLAPQRTSTLLPLLFQQHAAFHTTPVTNGVPSVEDLENLRMLPEFVQAEEQFTNGDPTAATLSLERVQDICDSSMGTTSPMSRSVHSLVLSYLTRSFSASSSSSSLLNVAHQAIARPTTDEDNRDTNDATARLYLSIVMGQPELVVRNTSSLLHAPPSLDVSHLLLYRGIALATTGSKDEAHVTFTQVHDMLDSLSSAETSEAVQTARVRALHNVGCVLDQHGSTEEALSTWKQALALAGQEKEGSNESATLTKCQVELLCNIGTLHTEQGDPNEGILCLSRAVAMLGATQNLEMVRPLTLLGRAHHADGRAVSAEGYFRSALGLLEEQNSTSAGPSMQVQHIETLRMYGSLLMDWEQRKTDYDLHMDRSNEIHQLLKDNGIVAMPTGLSLPLPNLGERRDL